MKVGDLNQHCGDCDVMEYCGHPFGYCLCYDERFGDMEESEYAKIAETATDIKLFFECKGCELPDYGPCESCEYDDDARDYRCEQVADYVERVARG